MPKREGTCPYCGKMKARFEVCVERGLQRTDSSGGWNPLFKETGPNEWNEDWKHGVAVRCKCGKLFFMYGLESDRAAPEVAPGLKEDLFLAWFCEKCGSAFVSPDMTCPLCGTRY